MRQYAIVGLGSFGLRMLERLSALSNELIIIDRDSEPVQRHKDMADNAYIFDAADEEALRRVLPEGLDAVIVDVGSDNFESAVLVTSHLKKLNVKDIIVKADTEERGEILTLVGATRIVYADREAAARLMPLIVSPALFNYMPIGSNLVIAEVAIPERYAGMTLVEAILRQRHNINVVAIRSPGSTEYQYFNAEYRLNREDILLVAGQEKDITAFSGGGAEGRKGPAAGIFEGLLKGKSGGRRQK